MILVINLVNVMSLVCACAFVCAYFDSALYRFENIGKKGTIGWLMAFQFVIMYILDFGFGWVYQYQYSV